MTQLINLSDLSPSDQAIVMLFNQRVAELREEAFRQDLKAFHEGIQRQEERLDRIAKLLGEQP